MKRIAIVTLALLLSIGMLAGCTTPAPTQVPTQAPQKTTEATATPVPEPTATPLPQANLVWYALGDKPKDFDEVFGKLNEISTEKIACTVETKFISWADFSTKYSLVFASGEKFDMIYTSEWSFYSTQAVKNGFYELTQETMQKYAPKIWEMTPAVAWTQAMIKGKIFMIPQNCETFSHVGAVIRGDLREKYGLPEVKTVEDFNNYLAAVAQNETTILPYNAPSTESWMLQIEFLQPNGYKDVNGGCVIKLDDKTGTPIPTEDLPEYEAFFLKMREFNQKGFWSKNVLNNTVSSGDAIQNGTSACSLNNMESVCSLWRTLTDAHPEWKPEVCDLMGDSPTYTSSYIVDGMAVFVNADNPERSLMWMNLVRSDETCYDLLYYGVEGKHWNDEGAGLMSPGSATADYGAYSTWGFRTKAFERNDKGRWPKWNETMESYRTRQVDNPVLYMAFDDSSLKNEVAALNNLSTKYWNMLLYGFEADPVKLMKDTAKLYKDAGQDKIRAEWIKQRDAFLASYGK